MEVIFGGHAVWVGNGPVPELYTVGVNELQTEEACQEEEGPGAIIAPRGARAGIINNGMGFSLERLGGLICTL